MGKNPKRAMAAICAGDRRVGGATVHEITLGSAAVLEQIGSPLVSGRSVSEMAEMIPTMFAMTRPSREAMAILAAAGAEGFKAAAFDWADTLPVASGREIAQACADAARRVAGVAPQGAPDEDGGDAEKNGGTAATAG